MPKPEIVYRIIEVSTGRACGSFGLSTHTEYDFSSVQRARHANISDEYRGSKYKIAKYRVTYELLSDDAEKEND